MRPVTGHFDHEGERAVCTLCRCTKQPRGRDAPLNSNLCSYDCAGYEHVPHVGSLWPGERALDFGFPVGDVGTRIVWIADPGGDDD